jgi:Ca2+-binding RTX toxin-like protein
VPSRTIFDVVSLYQIAGMAVANLKIYLLHDDGYLAFGAFDSPSLGEHGGKSATFEGDGGDYLVIKGKGLQYENDQIVRGTITSMIQYNSSGEKYASITNEKYRADGLPTIDTPYWAFKAGQAMLAGNDTMTGSSDVDGLDGWNGQDVIKGLGGDDIIWGNKGNDRLTGGFGADHFHLSTGDGHDVITDFQSEGDEALHDDIQVQAHSFTAQQQGHDTLLKFDDGTAVTLLDFKKSHLDATDILLNMG